MMEHINEDYAANRFCAEWKHLGFTTDVDPWIHDNISGDHFREELFQETGPRTDFNNRAGHACQ